MTIDVFIHISATVIELNVRVASKTQNPPLIKCNKAADFFLFLFSIMFLLYALRDT